MDVAVTDVAVTEVPDVAAVPQATAIERQASPPSAAEPAQPVHIETAAEQTTTAEEADELTIYHELKADMKARMDDGFTRHDWFSAQSVLNQRILEKRLSAAELQEISAAASGFVVIVARKKKHKGGGDKDGDGTAKEATASQHLRGLLGLGGSAAGGISGGAFAALAEDAIVARPGELVLDGDRLVTYTKEDRKERKKARKLARREAADEGSLLESNERDALELQLAKRHSTAEALSTAENKQKKQQRLKASEIEALTLKQVA